MGAKNVHCDPAPGCSLKLVYIFSVNPYLGPLQICLGRMVIDIIKFFFVYTLVLFAFACGMNQLLWYYADMERQVCFSGKNGQDTKLDHSACLTWRRFSNLFESSQTLFWASFGLIDLDNFELTGIQSYTRFWGLLMFGSYCVINVVVLLNLLIAMMNHSYQIISEYAATQLATESHPCIYIMSSSTTPTIGHVTFLLDHRRLYKRCLARRIRFPDHPCLWANANTLISNGNQGTRVYSWSDKKQ
ncbi:transient-receptor-potential-like protein [Trichonephila clavipes]|nr:transient-receptor-potential-like protein [Trichonephila clavipes]